MEEKSTSAEATADRIKKALERVRPGLLMDGGDVEFVSWNQKSGAVKVRLTGHCVGCPMAQMTLKQGIEA
ncbi:MAG: NifU family protein, partial [Planctomycetes bacterium]|nr:NifU family protein [Planctomycetota bacterium]